MKQFIVRLVVVVVLLALLMPVAGGGHAHALGVAPPRILCLTTLGCGPTPIFRYGVVCVDRHGHIKHWHGRLHKGWHCVAI